MAKRDVFLGAHISGVTADKILNSMYNPGTLALNPQVMNFAVGCFSIVVFTPRSQSVLFSSKYPVQDYSINAPAWEGWSRLSCVGNTSPQANKLCHKHTKKAQHQSCLDSLTVSSLENPHLDRTIDRGIYLPQITHKI